VKDLSPAEAAEAMGVSRSLIYRLVERGDLRAYRLSNRLRIPGSSIEEFRERNRVIGPRGHEYEPVTRLRAGSTSDSFRA
jgi:excisionase family DNA binding protein